MDETTAPEVAEVVAAAAVDAFPPPTITTTTTTLATARVLSLPFKGGCPSPNQDSHLGKEECPMAPAQGIMVRRPTVSPTSTERGTTLAKPPALKLQQLHQPEGTRERTASPLPPRRKPSPCPHSAAHPPRLRRSKFVGTTSLRFLKRMLMEEKRRRRITMKPK